MRRLALATLLPLLLTVGTLEGAGRELAPRTPGSSAYRAQAPLTAATADRFLTVWREDIGLAGSRILGVFSDRAGHRSSAAVVLLTQATPIDLHASGEGFLLLYSRLGFEGRSGVAEISPAGAVALHDLDLPPLSTPRAVARSGATTLILADDEQGLTAHFRDGAGRLLREPQHLGGGYAPLDVVSLSDGFLVFTARSTSLNIDRLGLDGSRTTTSIAAQSIRSVMATPLPSGGAAVAWSMDTTILGFPTTTSILTALVSASGAVTRPSEVAVNINALAFPIALHASGTGENVVLVYNTISNGGGGQLPRQPLSAVKLDAAGRAASEPVVISSDAWAYAAAFGPSTLLVARSPFTGGRVDTTAVDASFNASSPEIVSIVLSRQSPPIMADGAGTAVAVWTETSDDISAVRSTTLSPNGEPLATRTLLTGATVVSDDLAWSGSGYLTVIHRGGKLQALRLDASGQIAGEPTLLEDAPADPHVAVAWAGDRWVAMWPARGKARMASVLSNGVLSSIRDVDLSVPIFMTTVSVDRLALAFQGDRGTIVFREPWAQPCRFECLPLYAAFARSIDRDGNLGEPLLLALESVNSVDVAAAGDVTVAIYDDVAFDGSPEGRPRTTAHFLEIGAIRTFDVPPPALEGPQTNIAWNGAEFVLVTRGRNRLVVRRLTRDGRDAGPSLDLEIPPPDAAAPPAIAAPIPGRVLIAVQFSDPSDPGKAVVLSEDEMRVVAPSRRRSSRP